MDDGVSGLSFCAMMSVPMFAVCVTTTKIRFVYAVSTKRVGTPHTLATCVRDVGPPEAIRGFLSFSSHTVLT